MSRQPSQVIEAVAGLLEAVTPTDQRTASDLFTWIPTLDDVESAPDRAFYFRGATLDEFRVYGCLEWELTADLVTIYTDTNQGPQEQGGALARVVDDARTLALTLRSSTDLSYVTDFQPVTSNTTHDGRTIAHVRTFRIRYTE